MGNWRFPMGEVPLYGVEVGVCGLRIGGRELGVVVLRGWFQLLFFFWGLRLGLTVDAPVGPQGATCSPRYMRKCP
jgi:hypothetical protein